MPDRKARADHDRRDKEFGLAARTEILKSTELAEDDWQHVDLFWAGDTWCRKFLERDELKSKTLHGEAEGVERDDAAIAEGMEAIRMHAEG